MLQIRKIQAVLLISLMVVLFSGCESCQQNEKDQEDTGDLQEQISAEFQEKKNEVIQEVEEDFKSINEKVIELNDKIKENSEDLTEEQKKALDEIQEKRVAVNEKFHELKDVSEEEWDDFRATLEEELDEVQTKIDEVLNDF